MRTTPLCVVHMALVVAELLPFFSVLGPAQLATIPCIF